MIYINDKEVNFIYNLGTKVKEVFSYGTKIWPKQVLFDYMFFKLADGYTSGNVSYKFDEYYNLHNKYLKISTDGSNWSDWNEAISMVPNVKYYVKGEDSYVRNSYAGAVEFFTSDVSTQNFNLECGGNIMSLVNMNESITATGCFSGLFYNMRNLVTPPQLPAMSVPAYGYAVMFNNTKSLTAAPELPATTIGENAYRSMFYSSGINTAPNILPSTTLAPSCYLSMFADCKNLTVAPELPATTLADHCYDGMFKLSGITEAPELPATTLANNCYTGMFQGCSSLTQAPALPVTTLAKECYRTMFNNCSSLTQAPELPATTLADYCYSYMFQGCSSLTQAPVLHATTLSYCCYTGMFYGCTSLTQAPALPATTLAKECYRTMFNSCSSLTQAPELPATTLADYCYSNMFNNCTSLTQAPELPATTLANNCYNSMFYGSNKLNWIKSLFTTTPSTSYTKNWVNGVSAQGVFVKNINATWTTTGVNAVPTGWTVIYFDQTEGKYYTTKTKEVECDQYGNVKQKIDAMYFKLADGYTSGNVSYKFEEYYNRHNKYLKYSTDGSNWSDWSEQISMAPNVKYYVKGEDDYVRNTFKNVGFFSSDVSENQLNIECGGNVMSLCNNATEINTQYCFCSLFYNMTNLLTPPALPATTLAKECYRYMLSGCSSLTQAPELPATTLAYGCYWDMFSSCSSLTQAPALPVTTLATTCYNCMFENCSSLTQAPELPATTLTDYCYTGMFSGCSKLTQAPELPATTLADSCYSGMFSNCTSLTQAPALPVTTLTNYCYSNMFGNCTSLTQAPKLPATTLTMCCYRNMFDGCSSLTQAPELPATTLESECYSGMFSNCTSLTQAPELNATTLTDFCYYYMFSDCTSLTEITLNGDFNSSYATDWVRNVSPSGTFYNNSDLDIPVGVNGIPAGWKEIIPVTSNYMHFKLADGYTSGNVSYQFDEYYNLHNKYLKISTDVNNWQDWTETISMVPNVKYYVKGEDDYVRNSNISSGFFTSDVSQNQFNIKCGGNVMSLCNNATEINTNYCFFRLFFNMTNLLTPPKLPATTLANNCYQNMFSGCSSLTQAPKLPATTLTNYCYQNMFMGCSSLIEAPELPADKLTSSCYNNMFNNANKLNWIKALFTTTPSRTYTRSWVTSVRNHGVFVKSIEASWTTTGVNAVPTGWTVIYYDTTKGKYYTTKTKEVECDKYGNPL